jgi:hypothetical protein
MQHLEKTHGARGRRLNRWVDGTFSSPMRELVKEYCSAPIVLYTGAGVSVGPAAPINGHVYGLPTWINLLRKLVDTGAVKEWPADPWEAANVAVKTCGREVFQKRLRALVERADNYTENHGQLRSPFVSNAPTLKAVATFCGKLTGRIFNPKRKKKKLEDTLLHSGKR